MLRSCGGSVAYERQLWQPSRQQMDTISVQFMRQRERAIAGATARSRQYDCVLSAALQFEWPN